MDTASTLLITAGGTPGRLGHEKSSARITGSSPIDASSDKRQRHRLDRSGDRQASAALWRTAVVRLATDQRTRDYVDRRLADGKTKTEAIRCLRRYIAREVFDAPTREALV